MAAPVHLLGVALAFGAALSAAAHHVLVRVATDTGRTYDAVLFVMVTNVVFLVPVVGVLYYPTYRLTPVAWGSFIAAGLVGTLLGRMFLYTSIERIGASRTSPIVATAALFGTVAGVLVLGETLNAVHGVGIVCIVVGVAAIAWETSHDAPGDLSGRDLLVELLIPIAAAFAVGIEPVFANVGFAEGTPAPVGLVVKTVAATVGFGLYLAWRGALPGRSLLRSADLKWLVLAGLANTLFLASYYVGLAVAPINVVLPIVITNALFVVVISAAVMPQRLERVTWRLAVAAAVVVVGAVLITVYG